MMSLWYWLRFLLKLLKIDSTNWTLILLWLFSWCREGRGNAHLEGDYRKIGDVILANFNQSTMDHYTGYIDTHPLVLERLEATLHKNAKFEQVSP